jgi:hypothetical protein
MDTQPTPTQPTPTQSTQPETSSSTQPAETPLKGYISFAEYTNARLSCTPAETKTVPGTGPNANPPCTAQTYFQIPLLYDYGLNGTKALNEVLIELSEIRSDYGIQAKIGPSGRTEHSIMAKLDPSNADDVQMIGAIDQLYGACAFIVQQMRGAVRLPQFQASMAVQIGMRNPVYRPYDPVTGDPIEGRSPIMFLKLFSRGKPPMVEQTLFTGPDGKTIPWSLLQGVEMRFIPLVHVKSIYVGSKPSIQMEVVSAVVTSTRARGSAPRQLATLAKLQHDRPELADAVASQLAKLTMDRQDQLLGTTFIPGPPPAEGGVDQPTFAGILPTGPRAPIGAVSAPVGGAPPAITPPPPIRQPVPMGGSMPGMADFTAGAPMRVPIPNAVGNLPQIPIPGMALPPMTAVPSYDPQAETQDHVQLG